MGMKVPLNLAQRIAAGADLGFTCDDDGTVTGGFEQAWGDSAYPPPGYLPWNRLEVGNGDTYGFYWPIGAEAGPPIACTIMHDEWRLEPLASSLETAVRLHVAAGHECEEWLELAEEFAVATDDCTPREVDLDEEIDGRVPYWDVIRADQLLPFDPDSPPLLLHRAREMMRHRRDEAELDGVERLILRALEILPEYTAAWWELVQLRRYRRAAAPLLLDAVVNCLTSPLAFGHFDREKCLSWFKRLSHDGEVSAADPLWLRRERLTFAEGVRDHGDYEVYAEAIEQYHEQGLSIRAVRLRVLYGELMGGETVSFRERKGFTWDNYRADLRRDFERAGLHDRLDVLPPA
jgi:hypothetical protein